MWRGRDVLAPRQLHLRLSLDTFCSTKWSKSHLNSTEEEQKCLCETRSTLCFRVERHSKIKPASFSLPKSYVFFFQGHQVLQCRALFTIPNSPTRLLSLLLLSLPLCLWRCDSTASTVRHLILTLLLDILAWPSCHEIMYCNSK